MSAGGSTRREVLRDAGALSVAVMAGSALGHGGIAIAVEPGHRVFLSEEELRTLRALVGVFIPADADGGAVEGGCPEAIDALLGAFSFTPPRIYAGAPFSDRAGHPRNEFTRFLKLDAYEEKAWRLRIEGSKGKAELERNGPVPGWQKVYRDGLAALAGEGFADRSELERELVLRTTSDAAITALVDIAWPHTWELMYGPPEYGGNKDLLGWRYTAWQGDVQPRGWSREQIEGGPEPGSAVDLDAAPLPLDDILALAALGGSAELVHNLLASTDGNPAALRAHLLPALEHVRKARRGT